MYDYDFRNFPHEGINPDVVDYVTDIIELAENITTLTSFNSDVDAIASAAEGELSGSDLRAVLAAASVAKSSAYLWAPEEIGGYDLTSAAAAATPTWKKVLIGDVSGAAQYFTTLGWGAALGWGLPVANVAILGGAAVSAALSSGVAAILPI